MNPLHSIRTIKLLLFMAAIACSNCTAALAKEVWLAAIPGGSQGYVRLFERKAEWPATSRAIQVFQVYVSSIEQLSDAELYSLIMRLKENHIKLAIASPVLEPRTGCKATETYAKKSVISTAVHRVAELGGNIAFVAMDEPIWFASQMPGLGNCSMNIQDLVRATMPIVSEIASVFPNAKFGDIEPTYVLSNNLIDFARNFKTETGHNLAFVRADVMWRSNWKPILKHWRDKVTSHNLRFGVIIDGGAWTGSGASWETQALERFYFIKSNILGAEDQLVLQTWEKVPRRYFPENKFGTMLNFVGKALGTIQ